MSDFAAARQAMVEGQVRVNDVTDRRLVAAMRDIPREKFAPRGKLASAYADLHVEVAPGRWLIRPRDFSKLVQFLDVQPGDLVLDLACGLGYSSAVLARLAETVVAVEDSDALVERASRTLSESGADNAVVIKGSLKAGAADQGPFNVIFVNGAVAEPPAAWLDQLADGGRLGVFEMARGAGQAVLYRRDGGVVGRRALFDAQAPMLPGFAPQPEFVF
jgi:protein-L-isoaspartate(D-aspartate) O-methyltransferase